MAENTIECPKCHHTFSVAEALSADIEEKISRKFQKAAQKKEIELEKLQEEFEKQKQAFAKKQADLDKLVDDKLNSQKVVLEKKLRDEIQSKSKITNSTRGNNII